MSNETIIVETKGKVGIIVSTDRRRSMRSTARMNEEMNAAIDAFEADDGSAA
jgi:enoyl-CoA hydratase/carnithine racemase